MGCPISILLNYLYPLNYDPEPVTENNYSEYLFLPESVCKKPVKYSLIVKDSNIKYLKYYNRKLNSKDLNTIIDPINISTILKRDSVILKYSDNELKIRFTCTSLVNYSINIYYYCQEVRQNDVINFIISNKYGNQYTITKSEGFDQVINCSMTVEDVANLKSIEESDVEFIPLVIELLYKDDFGKTNRFVTYLEFDCEKYPDNYNIEMAQTTRQYFVYENNWFLMHNIYNNKSDTMEIPKTDTTKHNLTISEPMLPFVFSDSSYSISAANHVYNYNNRNNDNRNNFDPSFSYNSLFNLSNNDVNNSLLSLTDRNISSDTDCVICMSNSLNTLLLPCRHLCVCRGCAEMLARTENVSCPICRSPFKLQIQFKNLHNYLRSQHR